jgi:hypothetical protein
MLYANERNRKLHNLKSCVFTRDFKFACTLTCLLLTGWKEPCKWDISLSCVGFQILTDVTVTSTVFCNMTPCSLVEIYGCFERISCLCLRRLRSARNVRKVLLVYGICLYSRPSVAVTCNCEFWPLSIYNIGHKSAGPFRHSWLLDVLCLRVHMAQSFFTFGVYCRIWGRS